MRIPISEHFMLDEFLDPISHGNLVKQIGIAEFIRKSTGQPVTVNNWATGGQYQHSGFRPITCTIGSKTSEHRELNAGDYKIGKWTGKQMFDWAVRNADALYALGVRRIEDPSITTTWLHLDCKEHGERAIKVIDLKKVTQVIYIK
jgi:hypothetical protein